MTRFPGFRFPRVGHALAAALCLALVACGGGKDATAPDADPPPIGHNPHLPDNDPPPGGEYPGPPTPEPVNVIAGTYALTQINDSKPGQMVLLSNPDGTAIGIYRFQDATTLGMTEDQAWSLSLDFEDEKESYGIEDEGRFKRSGEAGKDLLFTSAVFGDQFSGEAADGVAFIKYDMDGDGAADTILGFQRILGPGD